ncbi:Tfp pilus assembly protein FimT/FimU [Cyanobium sp. ATX 6F1]|uniref:pilus assembly FimT family protein n=1 Tax=Cyanobium sp. ATX 6F1 TaxID=2823702 RepID=UPI0020CD5086|nr:prepilin-type N-terminal cleavage/methylation domain-containing protein [Cyanobium sp. ATX 6F1]MCP9915185.1 prepilin-type N-terminal cleavage/methylation domain-containing protein [Cyanobium sp. ATX 6F1]
MSRPPNTNAAFTLPELMISAAVLGLLAALSFGTGAELLARQRVEASARLLQEGILKGRAEAERSGQPCGLSLGAEGWQAPSDGSLPACQGALSDLGDNHRAYGVEWASNFPLSLRFSANGLVIDGGTAVVWGRGTGLQRCLVMALPLGVLRVGRYEGTPQATLSGNCLRDGAS